MICPQFKRLEIEHPTCMSAPCPLGKACPQCKGEGKVISDIKVQAPKRAGGPLPCDDPAALQALLEGKDPEE